MQGVSLCYSLNFLHLSGMLYADNNGDAAQFF